MELRFTQRSRGDLDEIWDYIACDSVEEADGFVDRVLKTCVLIAGNPGMGRSRDELVEGIRSFPVGNYLVFYHLAEDAVFIDRVLSGYRDLLAAFDD